MQLIDAAAIDRVLSYPALVDVLATAFRDGALAPPRHHHQVPLDGRPAATWLLMPAIAAARAGATTAGRYLGVKSVTVFPDNGARSGLPGVHGIYVLASAETGVPLAVLDATRLTLWRTAAASALAARHLARADTSRMVMVGAGALAPFFIRAHTSVRPIREVLIWNRTRAAAERIAAPFASAPFTVAVTDDLEAACRQADLISAATLSQTALIQGAWLRPGTHVDTAGAYHAGMRETDDDVVLRARIFVDTRAGAFGEAGDLLQPMAAGVIGREAIVGELADLEHRRVEGRRSADEITYFKSVGASIEDLAAAVAVYETLTGAT
jgi:ornithine cyclodeaminase